MCTETKNVKATAIQVVLHPLAAAFFHHPCQPLPPRYPATSLVPETPHLLPLTVLTITPPPLLQIVAATISSQSQQRGSLPTKMARGRRRREWWRIRVASTF
ncbi:uncharacterized protein DS421_13g413220 [Arachis hypogaea]|nr:uncharacterized protein DS421_13g413220 [Arachis hypogaea]